MNSPNTVHLWYCSHGTNTVEFISDRSTLLRRQYFHEYWSSSSKPWRNCCTGFIDDNRKCNEKYSSSERVRKWFFYNEIINGDSNRQNQIRYFDVTISYIKYTTAITLRKSPFCFLISLFTIADTIDSTSCWHDETYRA